MQSLHNLLLNRQLMLMLCYNIQTLTFQSLSFDDNERSEGGLDGKAKKAAFLLSDYTMFVNNKL